MKTTKGITGFDSKGVERDLISEVDLMKSELSALGNAGDDYIDINSVSGSSYGTNITRFVPTSIPFRSSSWPDNEWVRANPTGMIKYMYGSGYYIGTYWVMGYPLYHASLVVLFKDTFTLPDTSGQAANVLQLHKIGSKSWC